MQNATSLDIHGCKQVNFIEIVERERQIKELIEMCLSIAQIQKINSTSFLVADIANIEIYLCFLFSLLC